jgi:hypothetical protein
VAAQTPTTHETSQTHSPAVATQHMVPTQLATLARALATLALIAYCRPPTSWKHFSCEHGTRRLWSAKNAGTMHRAGIWSRGCAACLSPPMAHRAGCSNLSATLLCSAQRRQHGSRTAAGGRRAQAVCMGAKRRRHARPTASMPAPQQPAIRRGTRGRRAAGSGRSYSPAFRPTLSRVAVLAGKEKQRGLQEGGRDAKNF